MVKEGKGLIDLMLLWDEDGKVYFGYVFVGSWVGVKSVLIVCFMNLDGLLVNNDDVMVIDGYIDEVIIEGFKFYKCNGYYYIFVLVGGVVIVW